jgi:hypothetical protein
MSDMDQLSPDPVRLDALLPPEMAARAEDVGVRKARLDSVSLFALAVLAGAFISLGAIFATTVSAGAGELPYGVVRLLGGLAFSLGLILVIVGGAELFTGNTLIVMAWASGKISWTLVLRNWAIVYAGNLVLAYRAEGTRLGRSSRCVGHGHPSDPFGGDEWLWWRGPARGHGRGSRSLTRRPWRGPDP